jgi:hypothetical protein
MVVEQVLEQLRPLLGLDLVDLDEIVGGGDLQVLPLLLQILGDLAGGQLAAYHPRLLRLFLLGPFQLAVLVVIVAPGAVERPLQVTLRAAQLVFKDRLHGEEDDVRQVLHLEFEKNKILGNIFFVTPPPPLPQKGGGGIVCC